MLTATIWHRFRFDAAHQLNRLPEGHKCKRLHGHSYVVELELRGPVDRRGFVADYDDLAIAWAPLHEDLDHYFLNEVPGLEVPSTEILATWMLCRLRAPDSPLANLPGHRTIHDAMIARRVAELVQAVTLYESHDSRARVERADIADVDVQAWAHLCSLVLGTFGPGPDLATTE